MRILVTGSRTWPDPDFVEEMICMAATNGGLSTPQGVTVVHGACPKGADSQASDAAWALGLLEERHPADWDTHGKRAGFVRNAEMVELGADVCLAFIHNGSKGATMTADLAEKAGIPTKRFIR